MRARGETSRAPSLRTKLLIFSAALVIVPGILLVAIAERSSRSSLEALIGRQLAREAANTAERLSAVLRSERETLASFARQDLMREVRVSDIDKRVSLALSTLRDGSPARSDYLVLDGGQRVVAASDPVMIGSAPDWVAAAVRAAERAPSQAGTVRMAGPVRTRDGFLRLVMVTPVPDPDAEDRLLGTLVGLFDWEQLTGVARHVRDDLAAQGIEAEVLVSRPDGSVIGGARSAPGREVRDTVDLSRATGGATPGAAGHAVDPVAGLIIGRASLAPDLPAWNLLILEPRSHALAPARRLSRRLVITMGIALLAALGFATWTARRVVEPLLQLTRAIRGLSRGEARRWQVPVRSEDEVGTLAKAFNEMASDLDQAQRELVEAEKFAFVGELASGVAHEIRTALGVLGSSAQILERSLPEGAEPQTAELAQMVRAEVARLASVVNDLLTLDRARPLQLEAVRLSEPVFRALDFVGPQAREKALRLSRRAARDEPLVACEPELVYQVAVNLLANAIQAAAPGGHIAVQILAAREGNGGFEVRDDGPGIAPALRERMFQPFVTAREGGVGLGLTFVKRVVHDHRGSIEVESAPGSGTCIRILIPLAQEDR